MSREENLNYYYSEICDESNRLMRNNHSSVEFLTTIKYINSFIKATDKILEIGAGTGRYSLYLAEQGYDVTAIEYVQHNVDIFKSKITDNLKVSVEQGDALDLSRYEDNSFDITLVLGPLYHLYDDESINKAIDESIRVTKNNGIIMIAYLPNDSNIINWALRKKHLIDGCPEVFDENFRMVRDPDALFACFYIDEFLDIMKMKDVSFLKNVATDGMACHMKEHIDELNEEEFNVWMKYHFSTCERRELQGYSNHMLYICKKN